MAIDTVTIPPDRSEDPTPADRTATVNVRCAVTDTTTIRVSTFSNGANLYIGEYSALVLGCQTDPLTPEHDLDVIENLLCRSLTAISEARGALLLERTKALPCHGACHPATWGGKGTWVCSAVDGEFFCGREAGHDDSHIACTADTHAAHTWPREEVAV